VLKGRQMIRVSIGAQATEREHVEAVWRELQEAAAAHRAERPTSIDQG
jgi:aromatic-L-amino-acid decarboxylase